MSLDDAMDYAVKKSEELEKKTVKKIEKRQKNKK